MSALMGQTLRDRYRIEQLIGRGGMADVYLALDLRRQVHIALKMLREDLAEDPDFLRRFQREAEALARLDHPNIVRFYSFEREGNLAFIVMDYVSGTTLRGRLSSVGGPLALEEVASMVRQIGPALAYAHNEGYIHRDIKPGNIMIKEDGAALLSDFGIARATESATMTMGPVGTPAYMSPEQILGRDVSRQTDIYCMGVVLYEMVTGRRPFIGESGTGTGTTERIRDEHLHQMPPDPRMYNRILSEEAVRVIARALAKDPAQRWPDMPSMVTAWLQATGFEQQPLVKTSPLGPATRHPTPARTTVAGAQTPLIPPAAISPPPMRTPPPGIGQQQGWLSGAPPPVTKQRKGGGLIWAVVAGAVFLLTLGLICVVAVVVPALRPKSTPTAIVTELDGSGTREVSDSTATPEPTPANGEREPTSTRRRPTSTPSPTPGERRGGEILVSLDGSGDFRELQAAVEAAADGATLILSPGTHVLKGPLEIARPLTLRGAGRDQTTVVGDSDGAVVSVGADLVVEGITFRHEGGAISNVVEAFDATFEFRDCRFTGGVWDKANEEGGSGLFVHGTGRATVIGCESLGNGLYGIEVIDSADAQIEKSALSGNEGGGISFWGDASGKVLNNDASGNGYYGVAVNDRAQPDIEANVLNKNQYNGIGYFGNGGGTARDNECGGNGLHGIGVNGEAKPLLEANRCHDNADSGISYFDSAGGTARGNDSRGNTLHGIAVSGQAAPVLEGNTTVDNKDSGISYFANAGGSASKNVCSGNALHGIAISGEARPGIVGNDCEKNGYHGIYVYGNAQPTLEGNVCRDNADSGITFDENAAGSAFKNDCAANARHGIALIGSAAPHLEGNVCHENGDSGIAYFDNSGGVAVGNECFGNTSYGIYVAGSASPELGENSLHNNGSGDLEDQRGR